MAVSIEDIKKLRSMTGAGLADVKKALTEADGDFDKAKDLLRERGLAIAAKRSDRETSNGCVLVKKVGDFAAMVAVKCETDFVANGKEVLVLYQRGVIEVWVSIFLVIELYELTIYLLVVGSIIRKLKSVINVI